MIVAGALSVSVAFVVPAAPAIVSVQLAPAAVAVTVKVVGLELGVTEKAAQPPPLCGAVSDAANDPLNCSSIGVTTTLSLAPVPGKFTGSSAEPLFAPRLLDHAPVHPSVTWLADGVGVEPGETLGETLGEGASVGGAVGGGGGLPPPPPPQAETKSALAASAGNKSLDRRIRPPKVAEKSLGFYPAPLSPGGERSNLPAASSLLPRVHRYQVIETYP